MNELFTKVRYICKYGTVLISKLFLPYVQFVNSEDVI